MGIKTEAVGVACATINLDREVIATNRIIKWETTYELTVSSIIASLGISI